MDDDPTRPVSGQPDPPRPVLGVDQGMLLATLLTLAGYLLPWFRKGSAYQWSYSGWEYASLGDGGGWTSVTFGWLVLAAGAALFARRHVGAALTGVVAAIGTLVFSLAVVAASFGSMGERTTLNSLTEMPFDAGLPLLATGLGLLLATSVRAVVRAEITGRDAPTGQP